MNLVGLLWLNANNKVVLVSNFIYYEFFSFEFMKSFGDFIYFFFFMSFLCELTCTSLNITKTFARATCLYLEIPPLNG